MTEEVLPRRLRDLEVVGVVLHAGGSLEIVWDALRDLAQVRLDV